MEENQNEMLNTMIETLGGNQPEAPDPDPTPEPGVEESKTPESNPERNPDQAAEQDNTQEETHQEDRAQQAFIHMRQQNKRQTDILKGVAEMLGIQADPNDEQFLSLIQDKVTADQAQRQNVPVELLQRLQTLEDRDRMHTEEALRRDALIGLQRVKDTFKLKDAEVTKFTEDLLRQGINPMMQRVDLVREYKIMHLDDMVNNAKADAVAAEQARAAKANSQSTNPDKRTGNKDMDTQSKVNSVRGLEQWMKNQL